MPVFAYEAYDGEGRLRRGRIEALSAQDAMRLVRSRGEWPRAAPVEVGAARPASARGGRLNLEGVAELLRELATLVEARMPVDQALRLAADGTPDARRKACLHRLHERLVAGRSLSQAFEEEAALPPALAGMIRAGEASGQLAPVLSRLARDHEQRRELRARLTSALLYPSILILMAAGAMAVVVGVLVPSLAPLFDNPQAMPLTLRFLAGVGDFLAGAWPALVVVAAIGLLLSVRALRSPRGRAALIRLAARLPVAGPLVVKAEAGRLTRTLGMLMGTGVPMMETLKVTEEAGLGALKPGGMGRTKESVSAGRPLSDALAEAGLLPPHAIGLLRIGEESGNPDAMLLHLADMYEREVSRGAERATALLTPLLTVLIGGVIGLIILSVMGAITSVNDLAL